MDEASKLLRHTNKWMLAVVILLHLKIVITIGLASPQLQPCNQRSVHTIRRLTACCNKTETLSCAAGTKLYIDSIYHGSSYYSCKASEERCGILTSYATCDLRAECHAEIPGFFEIYRSCTGRQTCTVQHKSVMITSCKKPISSSYIQVLYNCLPDVRVINMCSISGRFVTRDPIILQTPNFPDLVKVTGTCMCRIKSEKERNIHFKSALQYLDGYNSILNYSGWESPEGAIMSQRFQDFLSPGFEIGFSTGSKAGGLSFFISANRNPLEVQCHLVNFPYTRDGFNPWRDSLGWMHKPQKEHSTLLGLNSGVFILILVISLFIIISFFAAVVTRKLRRKLTKKEPKDKPLQKAKRVVKEKKSKDRRNGAAVIPPPLPPKDLSPGEHMYNRSFSFDDFSHNNERYVVHTLPNNINRGIGRQQSYPPNSGSSLKTTTLDVRSNSLAAAGPYNNRRNGSLHNFDVSRNMEVYPCSMGEVYEDLDESVMRPNGYRRNCGGGRSLPGSIINRDMAPEEDYFYHKEFGIDNHRY